MTRHLNEAEPYYQWAIDNSHLWIYSECCADHFSQEEEEVHLLRVLAERNGYLLMSSEEGDPMGARKYRSLAGGVVEAIRFRKPYWKVREFCPVLSMQGRGITGRRIDHAYLPGEADVRVELGDYIVRHVDGRFYAYTQSVFESTFESIDGRPQ